MFLNGNKNKSIFFTILIVVMCVILPTQAFADNSLNPPSGLKLNDLFHAVGTSEGGTIINVSPETDVVRITDAVQFQRGAVWSDTDLKLDLREDFSSKMYLYFGNSFEKAADGITFTLQRHSGGALGPDGQAIGAWRQWNQSVGSFGSFQMIKNAFSIEFDTYYNKSTSNNLNMDYDIRAVNGSTNHIAWNFPHKDSSYSVSMSGGKYVGKLLHKDLQYPGLLSNDKWHTFTMDWNAKTKQFKYKFGVMPEVTLELQPLEDLGGYDVWWGFTGSTGDQTAKNYVAFDVVPGLVNAEVGLDVLNKAGESVINKTVPGKTRLTYEYDSQYLSGKRAWQDINFTTTINSNVEYIPGTLRYVDANNISTPIDDAAWKTSSSLETMLADMDLTNNHGKLCFDVKTKKVNALTKVTEQADYLGKTLILQTDKKSYQISTAVNFDVEQDAVVKKVNQADQEYTTNLTVTGGDEVIYKNTVTLVDQEIGQQDFIMSFQLPNGVSYQEGSIEIDGTKVAAGDIISTTNGLIKFYLPESAANMAGTSYDVTLKGQLKDDLSDLVLTSKFDISEKAGTAAISSSNNVTLTVPKQEYGIVTFYYRDENDTPLQKEVEYRGKVGDKFPTVTPPLTIGDFDYDSTEGNPNGTFTLSPQSVIFRYKENPGDIQIISYPLLIDFGTIPVTDYQKPIGVNGKELDRALIVEDTRKKREKWDVTVQVVKEMTNGDDIQVGALRYVYNKKELTLSAQEQPIYYSDGKSTNRLYPISDAWEDPMDKEGLKLRVTSNKVPKTTGSYQGVIRWNLRRTIDY